MLRNIRQFHTDPFRLFAALWPLALLAPYLAWIPRPMLGGYPWRQEIVVVGILGLTFSTLLRRANSQDRLIISARRIEVSILLPALVFLLWMAVSAAWAPYPPAAIYQAFQWAAYVLSLLVMVRIARRPRALRGTFVVLGLVVWVLSAACMVGFWGAQTDLASRAGSLFRYFSGFGEMMGVVFPIFAALALCLRRRGAAVLSGITALLAWLSTLMALERAPIIGALVGITILTTGVVLKKSCRPVKASRAWVLLGSFVLVTAVQIASSSLALQKTSAVARIQSTSLAEPNTQVRFLFWGIALEMFRSHPLIGIGGSNYEIVYPAARASFSASQPHSPLIAVHEEMLVQVPHNEYVQVLAELGVVGFLIFILFFGALARAFWRALSRSKRPLLALGAGGGIVSFALSSGASACSFEWMGGGLMFFFAAALVANAARATEPSIYGEPGVSLKLRAVLAPAMASSLFLCAAFTIRAGNSLMLGAAENSADPIAAERFYHSAISWDPRDAATRYSYGSWLYYMGRPPDAVPYLRYGVERGLNTSLCYSDLAAAQTEAGDGVAAEKTLAKAVMVYPRSVFLRVRHATTLAELGNSGEAQNEYAAAIAVDPRTARGWRQLIDFGFYAARSAAQKNTNIAKAGDLYPEVCILPAIAQYKRHAPSAYPKEAAETRSTTR